MLFSLLPRSQYLSKLQNYKIFFNIVGYALKNHLMELKLSFVTMIKETVFWEKEN
jgi:hypothetical protein